MTKCDIILLSYESPDLLKKCVRSVLDKTRVKSRLIIVDNGSKDPEVGEYLKTITGSETVKVEEMFNRENLGFAAGMNEGMKLSTAPFVCLLNNDCVVTDGWLEELIAVAESSSDIGLVNPQSNTFGCRPPEGLSIEKHAASLAAKKGKFVELGHAIGFACLIKREVIEEIGYLDEEYKGVCYEDTDFSIRARRAGFISVMAEGAYVFHVEQASRKNLKEKKEVYRRNKEIFENKWGGLLRVFYLNSHAADKNEVIRDYENLKNLARERALIDMWIGGASFSAEELIRSTIKHADISVSVTPNALSSLQILWRILTKKKKYNAIITDNENLLRLLDLLKPLHGAKAFIKKDLTDLAGFAGRLRKKSE
jgi:GT2 family glycosyltransferase